MAGMFSMLNSKFRSDGSGNLPSGSSRDETILTKGNVGNRTQAAKRPAYKKPAFNGKMWTAHPKDMGKHRVIELHPIMRRSICTLILAITFIFTGIITIIIELYTNEASISISGCVITACGLLLVVVGMVWFYFSKVKLLRKWEVQEQKREKKMNFLMSKLEKTDILPLAMITSKHTAKWPTKVTCNVAECQFRRVKLTSPNGNHYVPPEPSVYSDSETESISSRKVEAPAAMKNAIYSHHNGKYPECKATANGEKPHSRGSPRTKNSIARHELTETSFLADVSCPASNLSSQSVTDTTV